LKKEIEEEEGRLRAKKTLLIPVLLFAALSLTVMPAFAQPDLIEHTPVYAVGWACARAPHCSVTGCATLSVFLTSCPVNDPVDNFYVELQVKGQCFWWVIDLQSLEETTNLAMFCANPVCPWSAPGPITVVIYQKALFCVSALGCGVCFIGKAQVVG
jgi:hypothetical protein